MNKVVPGVLLTSIFLGLAAVSFQQYQLAEGKKHLVTQQGNEIGFLEENLDLQIKENVSLEEENYFLEEQLKGTRDSLASTKSTLTKLRSRVKQQSKTLASTQQKLSQLKRRYAELQSKKNQSVANGDQAAYIEQLKAEKRSLLQEMLSLRKRLTNQFETAANNDSQGNQAPGSKLISSMQAEVTPSSNNYNVDLLQAKIKLDNFSLRKRKLGKSLNKIGKNTDWKYTVIQFSIQHAMAEVLEGQHFKAKIINSQTGEVLSFVESNPNFPNSDLDSKGIGFEYQGKNIELTYYNADVKKGKDYHLAFFIIDESGNEHILPGANFQLVKKGKVVK